jgi:ABC-2 type transport system ATP-binding protein
LETGRPAATAPHDEPVLVAEGLAKRFGVLTAVDGVSFHVGIGETYGLLGPNGAGKTTTISMVAGLLKCDDGRVTVAGNRIIPNVIGPKAAIGLVPQELAIYPDLTGRENLTFMGRLYGMGGDDLKRRADEVLDIIGLADRADNRTDEYSGGMKRRLNIGIGLLHKPTLLILDEPTVGVDPQSRNAILESVEALSSEGMSVLYTTHYMEEAERVCDRVGIIDEGKLVAEGTRRELVAMVGERDRIHLSATGDLRAAAAAVGELDLVDEASTTDGAIDLIAIDGRKVLARLLEVVHSAGIEVTSVEVVEPDLEAVFLHLTGKALRD